MPAAGVSLILQLPGGERHMVSVRSVGELLAGASRLLKADALLRHKGQALTAASPLPASLDTVYVEEAAPHPAPPPSQLAPAAAPAPATAADVPECAICLEHFVAAHPPMAAGGCQHGFHEPCLRAWRQQSAFCPLCRGPMFCAAPPQPLQPPPPLQQQQQQQLYQQPATVVLVRSGGGGGWGAAAPAAAAAPGALYGPPPTIEETLGLLLRTRSQLQASAEWRLLSSAVRGAAPLLGVACGTILRGIAMASPGVTGHVASALLAAGTFGRVINALASGVSAAHGAQAFAPPGSVTCPQCRTVLSLPPGAPRFVCGQCHAVIQL